MWGCRQRAQYGWACGFCHSHAIMRGCPKQAKKLKAKHEEKSAWKLGNNPAEAEVTKPWWFDEDTELPDREAYEEDYEEVLRCLGNMPDNRDAATKLRTGHSLVVGDECSILRKWSHEVRNLHCWLVGEEWSIQGDDKGMYDDEINFLPHQWETSGKPCLSVPLEGWLPRDEDGFGENLPIGALAYAVLWGCESNLVATTNELKRVSDDWARGLSLGSIKKAWWQTMRLRRLRQKTTVPKYNVWSEYEPDTSSFPRTRWDSPRTSLYRCSEG